MADHDDVRRILGALPNTVESGVGERDDGAADFGFGVVNAAKPGAKAKGVVWLWKERVTLKKPRVPNRGVLAVRVADEADKQMLLASDPAIYFTEPHYNGFPAVLVRLAAIEVDELAEILTDAWRCTAPPRVVAAFDREHDA